MSHPDGLASGSSCHPATLAFSSRRSRKPAVIGAQFLIATPNPSQFSLTTNKTNNLNFSNRYKIAFLQGALTDGSGVFKIRAINGR
ncbi:MAG: hypothetical protein ACYDCD_11965 [Candidatus Acidiferrales bacterium]